MLMTAATVIPILWHYFSVYVCAGCPIPTVLWPQYQQDALINAFAPLLSSANTSDPCIIQLPGLAQCALDGSLAVQTGCCSTACSTPVKLVRIILVLAVIMFQVR
jgi:hypothetical protein